MRKWRIGTISMGLSLILLGIFLFLSQINGTQTLELLLNWWPLILIVLGIEITAFIFLSKQENPVLKYDFMSIVFVAILGMIGIGFTLLTSTGIMQEVQGAVRSEETTFSLPTLEESLPPNIKNIIIDTGSEPLKIESSTTDGLHIFGTYRAVVSSNLPPIEEAADYVMTKVVGSTLYLYLKDPSSKTGPFSVDSNLDATIVVPEQLQLEVRSKSYQTIDLYPGQLTNHWIIDHQGNLNINIREKSNIKLSAISNQNLETESNHWDSIQKVSRDGQDEQYKGTLTTGEGTYNLAIFNSSYVSVNMLEAE